MATHSPIGFSFNREYARELENDAREAVFVSVIAAMLVGIAVALSAIVILSQHS